MNRMICLPVFFLFLLLGIGCSDKEDLGEPISDLTITMFATYEEVLEEGSFRNYAYVSDSPFEKNATVIWINFSMYSGLLHNIPDEVMDWLKEESPITVRINGFIKPSSLEYDYIPEVKSIDFYVTSIYKLNNL